AVDVDRLARCLLCGWQVVQPVERSRPLHEHLTDCYVARTHQVACQREALVQILHGCSRSAERQLQPTAIQEDSSVEWRALLSQPTQHGSGFLQQEISARQL